MSCYLSEVSIGEIYLIVLAMYGGMEDLIIIIFMGHIDFVFDRESQKDVHFVCVC